MKSDREIEKMVSKMGLKRSEKKAVIQYSKGMRDGIRLGYVAVARQMLSRGQSLAEVREFLGTLVKKSELKDILEEAQASDPEE